jgi:hypothetical protein
MVTVTLFLFVVLIPFVGFRELQRVVGTDKLHQIFFGSRPPIPGFSSASGVSDLP